MGFVAVQGGGTAAPGAGGSLEPGGAVAAALVTGDLTIAGTCTITYRNGDQLYACGHPILGVGQVNVPMARSEIVATVPSELGSFKIANIGEVIGRFEQDRRSAIWGASVGAPLVPVELTLVARGRSPSTTTTFQNPKFSPLLMDITLFNGLSATVSRAVIPESPGVGSPGTRSGAGRHVQPPTVHPRRLLGDGQRGRHLRRIFGTLSRLRKLGLRLQVELIPKRLATVKRLGQRAKCG
jgi:hypothetical protein